MQAGGEPPAPRAHRLFLLRCIILSPLSLDYTAHQRRCPEHTPMPDDRIIKKYPNRRLYDTDQRLFALSHGDRDAGPL